MSFFDVHTNASCADSTSPSSLESAFHRVRTCDVNSSYSLSLIQTLQAVIEKQKLLVEQDKVDRVTEVKALLVEVAKFNAEHPTDQLDDSLDASVMYKQYLFLKDKFASQALRSAPVNSAPVSVPDTGSTTDVGDCVGQSVRFGSGC